MEGYPTPPKAPERIGRLGKIAIGAYTWIEDIVAPVEAAAGDLVTVEVSVRSLLPLTADPIAVKVGGYLDATEIWFSPDYAWIDPGAAYTFTRSFTMPNHDVTISVWSYYWTGEEWYADDYSYISIALEAVAPPVAGTISRMELEYDEARAAIPAYDIPQGKRGIVLIRGRNDTDLAQRMGISWVVKDPDGVVVEEYSTWEAWPYTGAGSEHEFIGGRFDLDKVGTYTISVGLLMNPEDPIYVDTYYGTLCTVAAVVPEYQGTISRKELKYDTTRSPIPVW